MSRLPLALLFVPIMLLLACGGGGTPNAPTPSTEPTPTGLGLVAEATTLPLAGTLVLTAQVQGQAVASVDWIHLGPMGVEQRYENQNPLRLPGMRPAGVHLFKAATREATPRRAEITITVNPGTVDPSPTPLSLTLQEARESHCAVRLWDGRVLLAGGTGPAGTLASAELVNPRTGVSEPTGPMVQGRLWAQAVLVQDGRALVLGGARNTSTVEPSVEAYDPGTGKFSRIGSLLSSQSIPQAAVVLKDGTVLVISDGPERFDPRTGLSRPTGPMRTKRVYCTATLLVDGRVLVAGGSPDWQANSTFATTEIYDPTTDTFGPGPDMQAAHSDHVAAALTDGSVLVLGGEGCTVAERLNPEASRFTEVQGLDLSSPFGATVNTTGLAPLPGGGALVCFRMWEGLGLARYDVAQGTFLPLPHKLPTRTMFTLTPLADGRALLAAGYGVGKRLNTAYILE